MRKYLFIYAVVVLMLAAPASAQTDDLAPRVDKIFEQYDKPTSPGCALAVIKDGSIVYKRGYGMADLDHDLPIKPDTVFHIASVSKQFTAMAILLLAQQGKLSLDDEVRTHVPELPELGHKITIRHLLHHTSGLRDQWNLLIMAGWRLSEDVVRDADILDLVSRMKGLNFKPGDQHLYSNTGYTLAAWIVKKVSGQSLREFCEANFFKPLGMTSTFFRDDHLVTVKRQAYGYQNGPNATFKLSVPNYDTVGASSLLTTVEDLAKWDRNFYDRSVGGDSVIEQMHHTGVLNDGEKINYALGLVVGQYRGLKVVEHSGGDAGYNSHLLRFPDQRFSVACLCNLGANPGLLSRKVADVYLAEKLGPEPPRPEQPNIPKLTEQEMAGKAGAYWNSRTEALLRIMANDGKLSLGMPGVGNALVLLGGNRFQVAGQPVEIVFEHGPNGAVQRLVVKPQGGSEMIFDALPPFDSSVSLDEYQGDYYSGEIDSTYRITLKDGKLELTRKKYNPLTLQPAFRDGFATLSILGTIRFTRDAGNKVTGFTLSSGRIRGLKFVKR